jgi:hypothetical protein
MFFSVSMMPRHFAAAADAAAIFTIFAFSLTLF